jgi:hypothetical protein
VHPLAGAFCALECQQSPEALRHKLCALHCDKLPTHKLLRMPFIEMADIGIMARRANAIVKI